MPINPQWAQALQVFGATLRDLGGNIGGYQPHALALLQQQQQQERERQEKQKAAQGLASAISPQTMTQSFPSPGSPTSPAPITGNMSWQQAPAIQSLGPALAKAAASGVDISPFLSIAQAIQPPGPQAPIKLGANESLLDPTTFRPVFSQPKAPDRRVIGNQLVETDAGGSTRSLYTAPKEPDKGTDAHQYALNLGLQPGTKPYNDYIRERTLPKPNEININPPPTGYVADPARPGALMPIPGGPADPNRPGSGVGRLTEDQAKNQQLFTRTTQQLPILLEHFEALSSPSNQGAAAIHPSLASADYQQAYNALTDIAASYLYSVSGATATPQEVERLIQTVVPKIGEAKASVEDKKARVREMVDSIRLRAGGANTNVPRPSKESGPQPGTVEDGYRFKGGNPADPNSWEKVS